MKVTIDTDKKILAYKIKNKTKKIRLYSKQAFELISNQWLRVGWDQKYTYTFSWMGRPIIQLPEDMVRIQEVIYEIKPDVIVETGIAHGGSLIFYAGLLKAMGRGRVIGVDVEIRPHNRRAIESHELFSAITLIEGSSTDRDVIEKVKGLIKKNETVMVILDSNHTKMHVLNELKLYSALVTRGSYIIATDGIMADLCDVPRGSRVWAKDNPREAAREFLKKHREFKMVPLTWPFNESKINKNVTHWPDAWLKRVC